MADYFLVLEGSWFEGQARPALADAWRRRSFEPARLLCAALAPAAEAFARRYHTGPAESLVTGVADGLPFDRDFWRLLVGEVLLVGAADIPEFQTSPDTLACLLAGDVYLAGTADRLPLPQLPRVLQAHRGSRDLTFGAAVYRPGAAGYNDVADVARLAAYLEGVRPQLWKAEDLKAHRDLAGDDERAEELDFVREWFPALRDLYAQAGARGRVVVCERIP
jgi:hypothetical protein